MTRPNITKGEWQPRGSAVPRIDSMLASGHRVMVATVNYGDGEEARATAQAIAALPDLLAALEQMLGAYAPFHQESVDHKGGEDGLHSAVRASRQALTKAGYTF